MKRQKTKTFVIDASVARSAGSENATYPISILCRTFLVSVKDLGYYVALSTDIRREWRCHESTFARKWFAQMIARKRTVNINDMRDVNFRSKIQNTVTHLKHQKSMEKDCLLLEAALVTDKIIFSLDEEARRLFQNAAATVKVIRQIHWSNPGLPEDDVIPWLEDNAPVDKKRQLG